MSTTISEDWMQLGKPQDNMRKKQIYEMQWTEHNLNLSEYMIAGAKYGGPIALTRDPRKAVQITSHRDQKPYVFIYSSSGHLISKFLWKSKDKGFLIGLEWTDKEQLMCVTNEANVLIYDIFGKLITQFGFVSEVKEAGILDLKTWSTGVAILTKTLEIWVVSDLESPLCEKLADMELQERPYCMEIISSEITMGSLECLVAPQSNSILSVDVDDCQDMQLTNGPFVKLTASPKGDYMATFTKSGSLWVAKSDFSQGMAEFNTKSQAPPHQMVWCGSDCVCLYWRPEQLKTEESLVLMIGPNGDYKKFTYVGPLYLISEPDGVRIISNEYCEFLQRVPNPTVEIFRIGSLEPPAILWDSYQEYETENSCTITNIRSIQKQLPKAVATLLQAATHEFDTSLQRRLVKAASFGKYFCESFNQDLFVNTCKTLRILNAVRSFEIGIPITITQYNLITPSALIDRLMNKHHHLLAYKLCEYLQLKPAKVLEHWACAKVESVDDSQNLLEELQAKLRQCDDVSYAVVASAAFRFGNKDLAIELLENEKKPADQVPLLLTMGEMRRALQKAIESGETDLVYLVLLNMKAKMQPQQLFQTINSPQFTMARKLFIAYCKEQDLEFLKIFFQSLELPHEAGAMYTLESFKAPDLLTKKKILRQAKDLFSTRQDSYVDAKMIEDELKLMDIQQELDLLIGKKFYMGTSISDTIYYAIIHGQDKKASKIKSEFKVPDKRYWWLKIKALAKMGRWEELEAFSKAKWSPIGYRPFVEVCLKYNKKVEAAKYVDKVADIKDKVELYVELTKFKEAIETAYSKRDVQLLQWIRSKSQNDQTKATIDNLLHKMGAM